MRNNWQIIGAGGIQKTGNGWGGVGDNNNNNKAFYLPTGNNLGK